MNTNKTIVYSALEVANICGVVNQTAINWIRNGYLKAFSTPGGQYRIYLEDLVAFMKERNMKIPAEVLDAYQQNKSLSASILVVDDDKGLNQVVTKFLEKKFTDSSIYQAFDGFEAGAILADKKPNIVLLDLDLPGVKGEDLCVKINNSEEFGKPVVCVMTALKDAGIEERLKGLGAIHFFAKPLNLVEIADSVQKIIESL
ncbi:MAG: response regulator [Treponemataceae bacterium]|jgi:excisionase family DNA binding protein|nr:response regulator [Spirochaetaceae bacterium]MEE0877950.1 response regulator [Treponemataceae bacterium]